MNHPSTILTVWRNHTVLKVLIFVQKLTLIKLYFWTFLNLTLFNFWALNSKYPVKLVQKSNSEKFHFWTKTLGLEQCEENYYCAKKTKIKMCKKVPKKRRKIGDLTQFWWWWFWRLLKVRFRGLNNIPFLMNGQTSFC